ncbi:unnamed protein product, partial [Parnassius mnemosyne]
MATRIRASPQGDAHQLVPVGVECSVQSGDGDRHPSRTARHGGRWRTECRVGTWNVRGGMRDKTNELIEIMKERELDVVCMSETKRKGSGTEELPGGALALWSGVPESENACQGVGVLLSSRLVDVMTEYKVVNSRLLWVRFKLGLTKLFLLAVYAPVASSSRAELEEFWENVREVLDLARGNERIVVCGDLNGWVGTARPGYESVLGKFGDKRVNDAGKLILAVCKEKGLLVTNTMFNHKKIHMYTRERKNERSMIDLFLVDDRLRKQVMDTRMFRGADLGTDHYLVITRFRGLFAGWRYRTAVTEPQSVCRIRSWKLQEADSRDKYHARVAEKLDTIDGRKECVERTWQNLRDGMVSAAEEVCGTIKRGSSKRRDAWWNDEVKEAVKKKKKAWLDYLASSNDKDMREKMKERYRLQKVHTKALIEEVRERCRMEADERLSHNFKEKSKLFWKEVGRTRSGATALRMNKVLSRTNDVLSEKSDVMQRWSEFYREMYACDDLSEGSGDDAVTGTPDPDLDDTEVISMKEIERAIRSLKCGKAAGLDRVTAEMVKYGGPRVWDSFHLLCNLCWRTGDVPDDWRSAVIVPLYKGKGSHFDCGCYRAISLTSLASKVYSKVLTRRMQEKSERFLWEAQCGFRPGRGCTDQMFSLRMITEKLLAANQKIFCAFVDLEKAFDKV